MMAHPRTHSLSLGQQLVLFRSNLNLSFGILLNMPKIALIINKTMFDFYIVTAIVDDGRNTIDIARTMAQEVLGDSSKFEHCVKSYIETGKRDRGITATEVEFITYTQQNFDALVALIKNHRYPDDAFISFIKQNRVR